MYQQYLIRFCCLHYPNAKVKLRFSLERHKEDDFRCYSKAPSFRNLYRAIRELWSDTIPNEKFRQVRTRYP